jgi:midasin (ATPase involved in ribosome maturation)
LAAKVFGMMEMEINEDSSKDVVVTYLQKLLDALDTLLNESSYPMVSLDLLLEKICEKLVTAFRPDVLTSSLPTSLMKWQNFSHEDESEDIRSNQYPKAVHDIPRKLRRVDFLRYLLRRMAPVSMDVAASICSYQADIKTLVLLFGTWIPLAPHISPLVSRAFKNASENPLDNEGNEKERWHMLEALHGIVRHYSYRNHHEYMKEWWSWSNIVTYLKPSLDSSINVPLSWTPAQATRWHAARVVAYLFDMSPHTMRSFLDKHHALEEIVPWMLHPWILHQEEFEWEFDHQNGVIQFIDEIKVKLPTAFQIRTCLSLHSSLVHLGEGLMFLRVSQTEPSCESSKLILTTQTRRNLSLLSSAFVLQEMTPILLTGPTGSGKSSLVRHLGKALGIESLLELHVDDDTDSKTLIGTYQTTDIPGEFTWQPGALTRAVLAGTWILLEDLDKVPLEIQAALLPLLESRRLPLGVNGEVAICHPNFRLFATLTTDSRKHNSVFSPRLWRMVRVEALPNSEWIDIATSKYPKMPSIIVTTTLAILDRYRKENVIARPLALRDFLKLLSRISNTVVFSESNTYLTEAQRVLCLAETVDIFAASCPHLEQLRSFSIGVVAPAWGLTIDIASKYLFSREPEFFRGQQTVQIGRVILPLWESSDVIMESSDISSFALIPSSTRLLETIAVCVRENEPTLLVGETGCGKTTILQQLAHLSNQTLIVQNLSLQTDSTDLLGGFRPLEIVHIARKLYLDFVDIFVSTFSRKQNADFLNFASSAFHKKQWEHLSNCLRRAAKLGLEKIKTFSGNNRKESQEAWRRFSEAAELFERQRLSCETKLAFCFTEGALVDAIRTGKWVLLDEINLASPETLQRLCGLLDDSSGSVTLTERGDAHAVVRHSNFRLFAAMNPATDAGKKDLPTSIRSRFTEIFVHDLSDSAELRIIASKYLEGILSTQASLNHSETVVSIVDTFLKIRDAANKSLVDASGQRPRYTLRTLCRALIASKELVLHQKFNFRRAIMEGFELAFEGPLDAQSAKALKCILKADLGNDLKQDMEQPGRRPGGRNSEDEFVLIKPFWIKRGTLALHDWSEEKKMVRPKFILTKTVSNNLRRLARAVACGPWPVLLEGPTSAGKTTLVEYLAAKCGNKVIRINNHEHTDIQEYTGSYVPDKNGSLVFQDGILVQALRRGDWVILDELNLAPSEVLEALNRLLDDNRQLYIAEVNELVTPHPDFRLFATQNPCGAYGGRKPLSRAFRNRFVEIHIDDIPPEDMITILEKRSGCPSSYAKALVNIMIALRKRRSLSGVFLGKDGLITSRDLLRWAGRQASGKIDLAHEGFMLLAERLRSDTERESVREEIEATLKVQMRCDELYYGEASEARRHLQGPFEPLYVKDLEPVVPTKTILRLLSLVLRCIKQKEPVLLVGDTGCGKTTVVQHLSIILNRELRILNCHSTTETSDLIGGLRPVRGRKYILIEFFDIFRKFVSLIGEDENSNEEIAEIIAVMDCDFDETPNELSARITSLSRKLWENHKQFLRGESNKRRKLEHGQALTEEENDSSSFCELQLKVEGMLDQMDELYRRSGSLFEWVDGSLIHAMKTGCMFLMDEISLAEDAVLERLNSVLEPSRTIVLAEKGNEDLVNDNHIVRAHEHFLIFATMNPGGDFGKRELSPALRSRFTEIWVPNVVDLGDIELILDSMFRDSSEISDIKEVMMHYVDWFNTKVCEDLSSSSSSLSLSLRDVKTWGKFVKHVLTGHTLNVWEALCHGCALMHLDGLGLGTGLSREGAEIVRIKAINYLIGLIPEEHQVNCLESFLAKVINPKVTSDRFVIPPFSILLGPNQDSDHTFHFGAPTTGSNLQRVLRAMQLSKPVLLEGSPGVGKTSLISALAKAAGYNLVRINLSEQTDISDLMGSDLPVPDNEGPLGECSFQWCDGVFLRALKRGDWILLDELNLATQSVLEGLNSCLDHRATVFIPELGKTFECPPSLRIFAAQNPLGQGGGRKGLPKSFLNRFTKVYVESLVDTDLEMIVGENYPEIPSKFRSSMIAFNSAVNHSVVKNLDYGSLGSPWEFNLRDVFRWCELVKLDFQSLGDSARDLYMQRFRSLVDRQSLAAQFQGYFDDASIQKLPNDWAYADSAFRIGDTEMNQICESIHAKPQTGENWTILRSLLLPMEAICKCVKMNWPCLLVGASCTGKTTILKTLASSLNTKLVTVSLTPSTDVNELVGCYEQVDKLETENLLFRCVHFVIRHLFCSMDNCMEEINAAKEVYKIYEFILKSRSEITSLHFRPMLKVLLDDFLSAIKFTKLKDDVHIKEIEHLISRFSDGPTIGVRKGQFHWVDGVLVNAMMNGYWLCLENANLCPSSVLDRLNSVMEPGGELLLMETSAPDLTDFHRSIRPHSDFRLFLSMNPERGEISRAMRNRCVEVCVLENANKLFDEDGILLTDQSVVDHVDVLSRNGIRSMEIISHILQMQEESVSEASLATSFSHGIESPRLFALSFCDLRSRGLDFSATFRTAKQLIYECDVIRSGFSDTSCLDFFEPGTFELVGMVSGFRENWNVNAAFARNILNARAIQFMNPSLCHWLCQISTTKGTDWEKALNQICINLPSGSDELEIMLMQILALFLIDSCCDIRRYSLMNENENIFFGQFSIKYSETLKFLRNEWTQYEYRYIEAMMDRWALLSVENQCRNRLQIENALSGQSMPTNVFDTSYWLHIGKLEQAELNCPITPIVYLLFNEIDEWADRLQRVVSKYFSETLTWPIQQLRRFYSVRDQLWIFFQKSIYRPPDSSHYLAFDETRFIVLWIWLRKAISSLDDFVKFKMPELLFSRQQLENLLLTVDRILLEDDDIMSLSGDQLWKKGGHPILPAQPWQWEVILDIRNACSSFYLASDKRFHNEILDNINPITIGELLVNKHPVLYVDRSLKQDLLEALCMSHWSFTEELRGQSLTFLNRQFDYRQVVENVAIASALFSASLKKSEVDVTIDTVENLIGIEALELLQKDIGGTSEAEDSKFISDVMDIFSEIQIAPVIELWLIHEERKIISQLSSFALIEFESPELRANTAKRIRRFIEVALSCIVWNIVDIRPFQTLAWAFESKVESSSFSYLLNCTMPIMLHGSSKHFWSNTLNALNVISPVLEFPQQWSKHAKSHDFHSPSSETHTYFSEESCQVRTSVVFNLIGNEIAGSFFALNKSHFLTLENHKIRESQTRKLIERLCIFENSFDKRDVPFELIYLFSNIIKSLSDFFSEKESVPCILDILKREHIYEEDLLSLQKHLLNCRYPLFQECIHGIVFPFVDCLALSIETQDIVATSKAWIFIGLLRMHLLVPQSPLDPGQKPKAKVEQIRLQQSCLRSSVGAFRLYSGLKSGEFSPTSSALEIYISEAKTLQRKEESQLKKIVERSPKSPRFIELFRAIREFWKSTAKESVVVRMVDLLQGDVNTELEFKAALLQEQSWQATASYFCEHLRNRFVSYEDVVIPLIVSVECMRKGLRELRQQYIQAFHKLRVSDFCFLSRFLEFPFNACSDHFDTFSQAQRYLSGSLEIDINHAQKCEIALSFSTLSRCVLEKHIMGNVGKITACSGLNLFDSLIHTWIQGIDTAFTDQSDDAAQERMFREQFPDHSKEFIASMQVGDDNISIDEVEEHSQKSTILKAKLTDDQMNLLYELFQDLYTDNSLVGMDSSRLRCFVLNYLVYHLLQCTFSRAENVLNFEEALGPHCMALSLASDGIPSLRTKKFSFHHDPNPNEVRKAAFPISVLLSRTSKLLTAFPGNEILIALGQVAEYVKKLGLTTTSIGKVMTGLEVVIRKAQEWEQHASVKVKLGSCLNAITHLVASWRKLELNKWDELLEAREIRFVERARRHWMRLFSVIKEYRSVATEQTSTAPCTSYWGIVSPRWIWKGVHHSTDANPQCLEDSKLDDLTRILDTFMLTSSVGEFKERLGIVLAMAAQASRVGDQQSESVFRLLMSVESYYSQFLPLILSHLNDLKKPIEAKLKSEVKLARWDEQSYYSLVESTEKNHRKLMRLLRDYDDVLEISVSTILEQTYTEGIRSSSNMQNEPSISLPSKKEIFPLLENTNQEVLPMISLKSNNLGAGYDRRFESANVPCDDHLRKIPQYHERMVVMVRKILERQSWSSHGALHSLNLCNAIFNRIELLRREKTTKQMKQRAFHELLRSLKANGFESSKWTLPSQVRDMKHLFQLPVPKPPSFLIPIDTTKEIKSANSFYNRSLVEVQRLSSEISIIGSMYMTKREMEIMTNTSYHGLLLVAQQRCNVVELMTDAQILWKAIETLTSLTDTLPIGQAKLLQNLKDFDKSFLNAKETVSQFKLFLMVSQKSTEKMEVRKVFQDAVVVLDGYISAMDGILGPRSDSVVTNESLLICKKKCILLEQIKKTILDLKDNCCQKLVCLPCDCFDLCLSAATKSITAFRNLHSISGDSTSVSHDILFPTFLASASQCLQSSMLSVQRLVKLQESQAYTELSVNENDVTIIEAHKLMFQEWESIGIQELNRSLHVLIDGIIAVHEDSIIPEHHRKSFVSLALDIGSLLKIVQKMIISYICASVSFFRQTSKLQYVIARVFRTLVAKGFCSDNIQDDESPGEGEGDVSGMKFNDADGTGMGEGEGKKDITEQIESEEQLLGLKGETNDELPPKRESNKLNEEDAEKGMEMEGEFDGELFDVPEEAKNGKEDDNEEEIECEMGEERNENEEVIDEKMWGGSDDEDEVNENEEQFEKDSKAKGETLEGEMRTKEDSEEDCDKGKGDTGENNTHNQEEVPTNEDNEKNPNKDVNEDLEENYEDKHQGIAVQEVDEVKDEGEMDFDDELGLEEDDAIDDKTPQDQMLDNDSDPLDDHSVNMNELEENLEAQKEDQKTDDEENLLNNNLLQDDLSQLNNDDQNDDIEGEDRVQMKGSNENKAEEAFGVENSYGTDNIQDRNQEGEDHDNDEEGRPENESDAAARNELTNQMNASCGKEDQVGKHEEGFGNKNTSASHQQTPNPFNNPGDATKFWHKKLNIIERKVGEDSLAQSTSENYDQTEDDQEKEKHGEFEYAKENAGHTSQVVGEALDDACVDMGENQEEVQEDSDTELNESMKETNSQDDIVDDNLPPRKLSKPTNSSTLMNHESKECDKDSDAHSDMNEDDSHGSTEPIEPMEVDDDSKKNNTVVSDLSQLNHFVEKSLDLGRITEEETMSGMDSEEAAAARLLWSKIVRETDYLSRQLCEKLRLVLEPLLATKLKGDYRTGKRINMKKVIGYIASGYRKDKIWLRRTKPAKRNYRVLLAVDNSQSMQKRGAGMQALAAMATLAVAMSQLEIGELGIASFGDEMKLLHPFHLPFTSDSGSNIVHNFSFDEKRTRTALCVGSALEVMNIPGDQAAMQLIFLISDGRIERDSRSALRYLMREMFERNILLVMILVEGEKSQKKDSIIHMKEVTFEDGKPKFQAFIDDYPFPYYIILDDMQSLPEVLGDSLRQWFEMIVHVKQK